jgi:hypothetical protein
MIKLQNITVYDSIFSLFLTEAIGQGICTRTDPVYFASADLIVFFLHELIMQYWLRELIL